jgi:hypothetical protein
MRAYELHVSHAIESNYDDTRTEAVDFLTSLFEDEISKLTAANNPVKSPAYEDRNRNEKAEKSTLDTESHTVKIESYNLVPNDKINHRTPFNLKNSTPPDPVISVLPKMNTETEQVPTQKLDRKISIDDAFDEKLGGWASSSFSLTSESDSDLSSSDI